MSRSVSSLGWVLAFLFISASATSSLQNFRRRLPAGKEKCATFDCKKGFETFANKIGAEPKALAKEIRALKTKVNKELKDSESAIAKVSKEMHSLMDTDDIKKCIKDVVPEIRKMVKGKNLAKNVRGIDGFDDMEKCLKDLRGKIETKFSKALAKRRLFGQTIAHNLGRLGTILLISAAGAEAAGNFWVALSLGVSGVVVIQGRDELVHWMNAQPDEVKDDEKDEEKGAPDDEGDGGIILAVVAADVPDVVIEVPADAEVAALIAPAAAAAHEDGKEEKEEKEEKKDEANRRLVDRPLKLAGFSFHLNKEYKVTPVSKVRIFEPTDDSASSASPSTSGTNKKKKKDSASKGSLWITCSLFGFGGFGLAELMRLMFRTEDSSNLYEQV